MFTFNLIFSFCFYAHLHKNKSNFKIMNTTQLFLGLIFSCIGLGYFMYGKKQKVIVPLVCGLVLMIFPYFIENVTLLSVIGIVLSIIPYFVRL